MPGFKSLQSSNTKILIFSAALSLAALACSSLSGADPETATPEPAVATASPTQTEAPAPTEGLDLNDLDLTDITEVAIDDLIPGGLPDELGETFPIASQWHIDEGLEASDWNSDPPTSGEHYPRWAPAGFYEEAIADEFLVHNLEHGYIVIYYNCSGLSDDECVVYKFAIQAAMAAAGNDPTTQTPKLIAVPRPGMENPITYTSWGRLYRATTFAPEELLLFVSLYRSQAPEGSLP
jgi:hypothetical protein